MFLKNYYKALAVVTSAKKVTYRAKDGKYYDVGVGDNCRGALQIGSSSNYQYIPSMYQPRTSYTAGGGVVFGDGTTPPTLDDYCLSGNLITAVTPSVSVTKTDDDDGVTLVGVYTLVNTGDTDVTVGEVALMCNLCNSNTTAEIKGFIERTVLDSPVTIPAGGVGQITYTIKLVYPTD